MSYAVQVLVVDKKSRKGIFGHRVKAYDGDEVKTNSAEMATVISKSSSITVSAIQSQGQKMAMIPSLIFTRQKLPVPL